MSVGLNANNTVTQMEKTERAKQQRGDFSHPTREDERDGPFQKSTHRLKWANYRIRERKTENNINLVMFKTI